LIPESVFERTAVIETERLILRGPRKDDIYDVFAMKSDPLVTVPYCREPYTKTEQSEKWIASLEEGTKTKNAVMWFITIKGKGNVIGDCPLWNLDSESSCGELGYELNRAYWGKGIATEATSAIIDYGFKEMKLNRIEACPYSNNEPSTSLLEKLGFTLEGRLRQRTFFRGKYFDQLYYSLLWEEREHRK